MARDALDTKVYIMMYKSHEFKHVSTAARNSFWNSYKDLKEACRLFWLTKGHLTATPETIFSCYDGYFRRLWYNNERAEYGMEGFDEAFLHFIEKNYVHSE